MAKYELNKVELIKSAIIAQGGKLTESNGIEKEQALEIMKEIIWKIKKKLPELIGVINLLSLYPVDIPINISTDFKRLYFNPQRVLKLKEKSKEEIEFQIMHVILHGLFGDNEKVTTERQKKYLWLAQDQRVNDLCEKLNIKGTNSERFFYLNQMRTNEPYMRCFGNYYLTKRNKALKKKAKAAQRLIMSDEHFFWHPSFVEIVMGISFASQEEKDQIQKAWREAREHLVGKTMSDKEIADKLLESCQPGKKQGIGGGMLSEKYEKDNGRPLEYKSLLRSILTVSEVQKPIMDSIDPMLYQYGLDVYGDVLLVEPKEEDERPNIDTICIALDTSGSCSGAIAQKFIRETQAVLEDMREYLKDSEIIFFQCDYMLQLEERTKIDEAFLSDTASGRLKGFGGTSFVPVFERIDEITKEEKKINALIYLTDGFGIYPDKEADYPVIFVMTQEEEVDVPDWINTAVME